MGIKVGDLDIANEIVELNFQLRRTQKFLDILINRASPLEPPLLTQEDIKIIDSEALDFVQKKFPSMGIQKKG